VNLGEARSLVRMYINEPIAKTWSDAQLNGIIQEANREVYNRLTSICPQWFASAKQFTWSTNTSKVNLPTKLDSTGTAIGNIVRVLGVFVIQNLGDLNQANPPYPMIPKTRISDLYEVKFNNYTVVPSIATSYPSNLSSSITYSYCLLGPDMYVWPVPAQDIYIDMFVIPTVATPTLDADNLLVPGIIGAPTQLLDHHELVPLLAAVKAKTAVGDPDNNLSRVYDSRMEASKQVLAIDQQIQNPVQVRGVG